MRRVCGFLSAVLIAAPLAAQAPTPAPAPARTVKLADHLYEITGISISQVALNWVTRKPGVDTVIIGARNEQQLRDNLATANWTLTDAEVERLDEASALPLPYPYWHQQKFAADRNPPAKHVR